MLWKYMEILVVYKVDSLGVAGLFRIWIEMLMNFIYLPCLFKSATSKWSSIN